MKALLIVFVLVGAFTGSAMSSRQPLQGSDIKALVIANGVMVAFWLLALYGASGGRKFLGMDRKLIVLLPILAYAGPAVVTFVYLRNFS